MAPRKKARKTLKRGKRLGGTKLQRSAMQRVTLQRRMRGGRGSLLE